MHNLLLVFFLNLFQSEKGKEELSHPDVKRHQLGCEPPEHKAGHRDGPGTAQLQGQRLLEAEWLRGAEVAARLEHHQRHAACWMEMELLQQQLQASQEKVGVLSFGGRLLSGLCDIGIALLGAVLDTLPSE